MSEPWSRPEDAFDNDVQPILCPEKDPEQCKELHNETETNGIPHHYGCGCGRCMYEYWKLKGGNR